LLFLDNSPNQLYFAKSVPMALTGTESNRQPETNNKPP